MYDVNTQEPITGRVIKENGTLINIADIAGLDLKALSSQGKIFIVEDTSLAVTAAGAYVIHVKTGDKPLGLKIGWCGDLKTRFWTRTGATITVEGTEIVPFCRKTDSEEVLLSTFFANPTYDITGSTKRGNSFAPAGQFGEAGGSAGGESFTIIEPDYYFLLAFVNAGTGVSDITVSLICWEL